MRIWRFLQLTSLLVIVAAFVVAAVAATQERWDLLAVNLITIGANVFLFGFASAASDIDGTP